MGAVISPNTRNLATVSSALAASNTTASNVLFTIVGKLKNCRLWGVVTTVLSSNITAAHWRANDQTNTPDITLAAGTTLSSATVGTTIEKKGLAAAALVSTVGDQVRISEHATSGIDADTPFNINVKNGVVNTIDFRYTTTNIPATGVIQFYLEWEAASPNASVS